MIASPATFAARFSGVVIVLAMSIALGCAVTACGADSPPGTGRLDEARKLFAAGKNGEAEAALVECLKDRRYSGRRAEAQVLLGRCLERRGDFAGARKSYGDVVRDDAARRREPDAVREAFDRLHSLMVTRRNPATTRRRLLEDAVRSIPRTDALSSICEREGDARIASGDICGAIDAYELAPSLSGAGADTLAMLKDGTTASRRIGDADIAALSRVASRKPDIVRPLCGVLSKRRDGWRADDFLASFLLANGKGTEAADIWRGMVRHGKGPTDAMSYSYCEALAKTSPKTAMAEFDRWIASNPKSPLADRARLVRAELEAAHGDLELAIDLFEGLLANCPKGALSEAARGGMEDARRAKSIADAQKKRERARADAARANPVQARVEAAEALLAKGKFREAVRAFGSLRNTVGPAMRDRVLYGLGEAMRGNGDSRGALETLRAVARSGAASTNGTYAARANRAIGDIRLEDTGDYDGAVAAYGKFLAMRPDLAGPGFWMNYGLALMASGRGEEATQVFSRRRDQAVGDPAEFAKWDNMVKKCGQGRERQREAVQERGALAAMDVAEALLDGDEAGRALKIFRRVSPVARRLGLGDRCAIGEAQCLAALGRDKAALKAYDEFAKKHPKSPLAPRALLRAGVLCASPAMNDFREARKRFDAIVGKYPSAPEAEAAEFYSATLAWRGQKWNEAERLHRAFVERHPDSPLASVALDERLPAIAKKSLVAARKSLRHEVEVVVGPKDRQRQTLWLDMSESTYFDIEIRPKSGWLLTKADITRQNSRSASTLWTGDQSNAGNKFRRVFHLYSAFSSQEFVMIDGRLVPDGNGDKPVSYPFRVTAPSADIDWDGFGNAGDEASEGIRHAILALNCNSGTVARAILLRSPFDDDQREGRPSFRYGSSVSPVVSLSWSPRNALSLDRNGDYISNGWEYDVKAQPNVGWPLRFQVLPLSPCASFSICCAENVGYRTSSEYDYLFGRIVDIDLDVDANYDGSIGESDEPLEETHGGIVGVHTGNLARIELKIEPSNLPGKARLSATNGSKIRVWKNPDRTQEVTLPKTWDNVSAMPGTLYVEGVTPSAAMRDIELKLEYDENINGENKDIFKCSDKVKLTAVKIDVRKIWFNYNQDSANADALNIRMSYNENVSLPEYVKDTSNYPAAYVRNTIAKIKVSFSITPSSISSARIYGLSDDDNGSLGDALEKQVAFSSGVSQSTLPTGENSEFVEFELSGQTPSTVFKSVDSWTWGFSEVDGLNVSSLGLVGDQTFGHVIYTLWDYPKAPWNQTVGDSHNPWVNALSFAIETAGCTNKNDFGSMEAITQYLHSGHGLTYDTYEGAPRYAYNHLGGGMSLSSYMVKGNSAIVNCYDQASGVVSLGRLLGIGAIYKYKEPFGYINTVNLVGIGLCNNPFFESNGTTPIVGSDWLEPLRKHFGNHAFVSYDDKIFDACVGPCLGDWTLTQYLYNAIDTSTTPELEAATPRYSIVIGAITDVW